MPGKHVRFASISTAYPASVPSLSYSAPSVPSSSGPRTPPSHSSGLPSSHHAYSRPQPKRSHSYPLPTRVHSLLAYSHHPAIKYDVSLPTSTITSSHKGLSTASFSEPAVYPPVSSLVIQIPHHIWPISVNASHNGQYVTVNDVFAAVYHSLRTNVSSSEYRAIPSKKDAEKVRMAYEMRYRRLRDRYAYESEKQQGVKRVDFLNGHTRFMGLATSSHGSSAWVLHLS
ncbi:hypothetical protein BT96DRAFT_927863 [Gymnopus androsaceus JB14]|uniref:DUF6699 domain-containing protein n=1 Tax=Gymnopus androsaceus JB14 TaxID=1447944 RepID=A0A6A4GMH0_9AGAR|nr:hypothetical protein BT96DRAFT_927863 [Gymnopus androsaceus JB14]